MIGAQDGSGSPIKPLDDPADQELVATSPAPVPTARGFSSAPTYCRASSVTMPFPSTRRREKTSAIQAPSSASVAARSPATARALLTMVRVVPLSGSISIRALSAMFEMII